MKNESGPIVTITLCEAAAASEAVRSIVRATIATKNGPLKRTPHRLVIKGMRDMTDDHVVIKADIYGFGPERESDLAVAISREVLHVLTNEKRKANKAAADAIARAKGT